MIYIHNTYNYEHNMQSAIFKSIKYSHKTDIKNSMII